MSDALDDAAARALWMAQRLGSHEQVGVLYDDGGIKHSEPQSQNRRDQARGSFTIPTGSLRGLFHTHPARGLKFSDKDKQEAARLGVPSYVASGNELMRYTPGGHRDGVPFLGQIPIEEIRKLYLAEGLKK